MVIFYWGGNFNGTADFDPGAGVYNMTANTGYRDAFILKWDSLGNFIWAKRFGNSEIEHVTSLDVDNNNNIYATGNYRGHLVMDPNTSIYDLDSVGAYDIFILKLDPFGNFNWTKSIGGLSYDYSDKIELDNQGNIYLSGNFIDSADFDPSPSYNFLHSKGYLDVFISKFDNTGALVWVESFGGGGYDRNYGMKLDKSTSNIYLTGQFKDSLIFNSNPSLNNYAIGGTSAYLVKINFAGNFIWSKNFVGQSIWGSSVNVDTSNNIYLTGSFSDTTDFDCGSNVFNLNPIGLYDVFVLKMSSNTSSLNDNYINKRLEFFPNPNTGIFNVKLQNTATIQILDAFGRELFSKMVSAGMHQIQLEEQANGTYFMKIKTEKAIITERIIINR